MKVNYIVPSELYPKKQFILPNIKTEDEVAALFAANLTLKEYCEVGLLYGCGLRISEVCNLRIGDIESDNQRLKVVQGKGAKDRYTLLPTDLLLQLRAYCIVSGRPKEYLFTSSVTKLAYCVRSMQVVVNGMIEKDQLLISNKQEVAKRIQEVRYKKWNVYAKAPFAGPAQIVEYLGRYTHKVATTAHRLLAINDTHITFKYKDYADGNQVKEMELSHEEFLRRYEQHILPRRFVKIRHSGYLCHRNKTERIGGILAQLSLPPAMPRVAETGALRILINTGIDITTFQVCKRGKMELVQTLIMHNGCLVDVKDFRNRGSPTINSTKC